MTDVVSEWCAGLRVIRSRALTTSELGKIRLSRRWMIAKASAWLSGVPIVLAVSAAALASSSGPGSPLSENVSVILAMLGIFLGIPVCIVVSNDYFKRAGVLRRQCRDSGVLICEGPIVDLAMQPKQLRKLRGQIGNRPEVVLEVLMQSSLVWAINGSRPASWVVVPRGRTAVPPDHARLAAQHVTPVETKDGTFRLHQRPLSEEECSELGHYLPRIKTKVVIIALVLNALAAIHLMAHIREPAGLPIVGILVVMGAGWCDTQMILGVLERRRMRRDLRERFVVIYQTDPAADASEETVVEFLPHSQAEWTAGGRPAPWRRLYGSAPRHQP